MSEIKRIALASLGFFESALNKALILGKSFERNSLELVIISISLCDPVSQIRFLNFSRKLPKYITTDNKTFEVIGLLQAEMSKTFNRPLTFCNSEPIIINKVMDWFVREFKFSLNNWKWYIKVNINEPLDINYKKQLENKVVNFWLKNTKIDPSNHYPKRVSYIKNTKNKILREDDFGSLIIEKRDIIFTQFIINLVKKLSSNITNYDKEEIRMFMRGIIAGESTVEMNKIYKSFNPVRMIQG